MEREKHGQILSKRLHRRLHKQNDGKHDTCHLILQNSLQEATKLQHTSTVRASRSADNAIRLHPRRRYATSASTHFKRVRMHVHVEKESLHTKKKWRSLAGHIVERPDFLPAHLRMHGGTKKPRMPFTTQCRSLFHANPTICYPALYCVEPGLFDANVLTCNTSDKFILLRPHQCRLVPLHTLL